jgi:hypothetical protein
MEMRGNTYYWSKHEFEYVVLRMGRTGKVDRQLGGVSENCCFFVSYCTRGERGERGERWREWGEWGEWGEMDGEREGGWKLGKGKGRARRERSEATLGVGANKH